MCKECGKPCNGSCRSSSSNDIANLTNKLAELSDAIDDISNLTKFLKNGHPILLIQNALDIESFDVAGDGAGFDGWEGWAICNGGTHKDSRTNKNVVTPNFTDRFVVMATGEYNVDDIGGLKEVTLTVAEMPTHNHDINDPGHTHVVDDPGHDHAVTDPGHTHAQNPHHHAYNDTIGDQAPGYLTPVAGDYQASNRDIIRDSQDATATNQEAITGLTVNEAFTGISVNSHATGVTTEPYGDGDAHENRPPYYAAIYVMYIG